MNALVGQDLVFSHPGHTVLQGVSLQICPGEAMALLGASGSGKTTLLWLLAGLLEPASGSVTVSCGESNPVGLKHSATRIGMVFQGASLWDHLTAEQHLRLVLAGKGLGRSMRRERVEEALCRMQLGKLRKRRPGQLSGGERQRLAVARALVARPQWLILDEPLAHLDGPARTELFGLLREALMGAGAGVLMATHNAGEAMRLADQVSVLIDGRIAQTGPADHVYRQPASLAVAQAMGPAVEVRGHAEGSLLVRDGRVLIENLPPGSSGKTHLILRPEDVQFQPDPAGPAIVGRCEFTGGAYVVSAQVDGIGINAQHPTRLLARCRGRLALFRPRPAGPNSQAET